MELTSQANYYAATAYNSTTYQPPNRKLLCGDRVPQPRGGFTQNLNPYHFEPLEGSDYIGCTEFNADTFYKKSRGQVKAMRSYRHPKSYKRAQTMKGSRYRLAMFDNWAAFFNLIALIGYSSAIFGVPFIIIVFMFAFLSPNAQSWLVFFIEVKICLVLFVVAYATYRVFNYLASTLPDKKANYLDRRTGMIVFSKELDKQKRVIPFGDCDPYLFIDNTSGMNRKLLYFDRYRGGSIRLIVNLPSDVYVLAAYLRDFMDISKPLPDVPDLEAYRDQDPVTVAYDKATGRNPRYWRDMSLEELKAKVEEKRKKLRFWFGKDMVRKSD